MNNPGHWRSLGIICLILAATCTIAAPPLQVYIDTTPAGETLELRPGIYVGPVVITKPIIIDGHGKVTLHGQSNGTIMTIQCDGVEVRNMRLTASGRSHDQVDSGVLIEADHVLFENNTVDNCLFGVHVSKGDHNIIRGNVISSLIDREIVLRGEGIRLWYSKYNLIEDNIIFQIRDMVLASSPYNKVFGNEISGGRMGMELVYSQATEIAYNVLTGNEHGVVGVYSDSLYIHHNRIEHQNKLSGSAVAVKGSSQTRIEYNEILDCAVGLTANSPIFPEDILYLLGNTFAYNSVAMFFYGDRGGHVIHGNHFQGNFRQVAVTAPSSAIDNHWLGNYWQDYVGFDLDGDGVGDKPYTIFLYSDRIWMDRSMAKFYRGSPNLEIIDFVERLVPFSQPAIILVDPKPMMKNQE